MINSRLAAGLGSLLSLVVVGCRSNIHSTAKEECLANNGEWKQWSRLDYALERESCNLRTGDYGKSCKNSEDCEGHCLANGVNSGECSEFENVFGCFSLFEDNEIYEICVD